MFRLDEISASLVVLVCGQQMDVLVRSFCGVLSVAVHLRWSLLVYFDPYGYVILEFVLLLVVALVLALWFYIAVYIVRLFASWPVVACVLPVMLLCWCCHDWLSVWGLLLMFKGIEELVRLMGIGVVLNCLIWLCTSWPQEEFGRGSSHWFLILVSRFFYCFSSWCCATSRSH